MKTHIFAICAYGESPYLESCILSLLGQKRKSDIIICTSTPNEHITALAGKYNIPLYIREGKSGIGDDWNFAFESADARFVTLAHQDDKYHSDYTSYLYKAMERWPDMSLFSTDYMLIRGGKVVWGGTAGIIKKLLRMPLRLKIFACKTQVKKAALIFGNPIICPSCAYNKEMTGSHPFSPSSQFVLDWENLWRMASEPGRFICEEKPLMAYRMHAGSQTEKQIIGNTRFAEEETMFEKIWPATFGRLLMKFYCLAARAYH